MTVPHQVGDPVRSLVGFPVNGDGITSQSLPPATNVLTPSAADNQQRKRPRPKETENIPDQYRAKRAKIPNPRVQMLRRENEQLLIEIEVCQKQLSLLKRVYRTRQRPNTILERLEEQIQEAQSLLQEDALNDSEGL